MSNPLPYRDGPWEFDRTCTKRTYTLPTGEVARVEIIRPDADVEHELADRAAKQDRRAAIMKRLVPSRANLLSRQWLVRRFAAVVVGTVAVLLIVGFRPL